MNCERFYKQLHEHLVLSLFNLLRIQLNKKLQIAQPSFLLMRHFIITIPLANGV